MEIQRGFRDKLEKYFNLSEILELDMNVSGASVYDFSCFGVDENNKLSDDRYMIFYNQTRSPNGEISYSPYTNGAKFSVNLSGLPASINKLVFTVSIDGSGTMGQINSHTVEIGRSLTLKLSGSDFHDERAIISIEIYRKDTWRIGAVAAGFDGGLRELLKSYGGKEANSSQAKSYGNAEAQASQAKSQGGEPLQTRKPVELRKGQKVNLDKATGEILINLNWHKGTKKGWFSTKSSAIDLDLGCLYELKNGTKGSIQALGNNFGRLHKAPYIALDGDDRTGEVSGGENLRVNGAKISEIERILIYTFIYEGAANWKEADGVVTVKCPGSRDVIVRMDEYDTQQTMCAIAMLENINDETFSVEKLVKFFDGHRKMDEFYHWGLKWVYGKK